jgi:hypothetical protein
MVAATLNDVVAGVVGGSDNSDCDAFGGWLGASIEAEK